MRSSAPMFALSMSPLPLLSASQLSVAIDGRQLLRDIDLTLSRGEITTVIGPNGAGKSTLLKALLGLLPLSSGSVRRAADLRIGYMPQKLAINPMLPISCQRFLRQTGATVDEIAQALAETGVADLNQQPLQAISGGELQRVLLARALLRRPNLLVLDEPAQGVDVCGQAELYRLLAGLRDRYQCAVLLVSHDLHLVMAATDRVLCLNQHICCQGRPEDVRQHPEYLGLFGQAIAPELAIYTHHHDHDHDVHGNVTGSCQHHNHATPTPARHSAVLKP